MVKKNQVYKCPVCGIISEVLHDGAGILVCCGEPMILLTESTLDQGQEKHLPIIEQTSEGIKVKVGEIDHPMTEEHYIEWIEILADGKVYRQNLLYSDKPEALFKIEANKVIARSYCNLHGLWKS